MFSCSSSVRRSVRSVRSRGGGSRGGGNNVRSGRGSAHDGIRTLVLVDFRLLDLKQIVMLLRQWPRH